MAYAKIGVEARNGLSASEGTKVLAIRAAIILVILAVWEGTSHSGLFFKDVIPSIATLAAALFKLLSGGAFYTNLMVTSGEIAAAMAIGSFLGIAVGLLLGANPFLARTYEPYIYYFGPTPKIIFFSVLIMLYGVGPGSKIAMGAISCFFPITLSTLAGMREINPVLIRVGKSFSASRRHMVFKILMPAMRVPMITGIRLGLGVAIIGTLLAETKLSNKGLGFMVIQSYNRFDMPTMYALIIVVVAIAVLLNMLIERWSRSNSSDNLGSLA